MISSNSYLNASLNNLNFSFKTSSGDEINLSMYDNKSLSYKNTTTKNQSTTELTLSHQYGYSFEFKSNGITEQDMKEIKKAIEDLTPKIDDFMKNVQKNEPFSDQTITNLANSIKKELPDYQNQNEKNLVSSNLLDLFDNLLEKNKADMKLLQNSKKLFDEIQKQLDSFSLYA
ncbi:hypothetical protein CIG11343_1248 [Campylobacter iguaniorum]|uniref:hypothetical protein n=1 Tax=Campylobacter iguaniorum TaxID=1244531 RepID=UPI0007C9267B|nr:hypothetical protein [Campylobacter iguaniorum]ANE36261.1 hypothetical protein CIG11343_1248 [Campylobacter iguaniorum]